MKKAKKNTTQVVDAPIVSSAVAPSTVANNALEQVRVYRVTASALQVKLTDEPMTDLENDNWRKRDGIVTNLDFSPPELEQRYVHTNDKSGQHGIELLYKTSRAEWDKEQAEKVAA